MSEWSDERRPYRRQRDDKSYSDFNSAKNKEPVCKQRKVKKKCLLNDKYADTECVKSKRNTKIQKNSCPCGTKEACCSSFEPDESPVKNGKSKKVRLNAETTNCESSSFCDTYARIYDKATATKKKLKCRINDAISIERLSLKSSDSEDNLFCCLYKRSKGQLQQLIKNIKKKACQKPSENCPRSASSYSNSSSRMGTSTSSQMDDDDSEKISFARNSDSDSLDGYPNTMDKEDIRKIERALRRPLSRVLDAADNPVPIKLDYFAPIDNNPTNICHIKPASLKAMSQMHITEKKLEEFRRNDCDVSTDWELVFSSIKGYYQNKMGNSCESEKLELNDVLQELANDKQFPHDSVTEIGIQASEVHSVENVSQKPSHTDVGDDNTIPFKDDVYQNGSYKKICDNIISCKEAHSVEDVCQKPSHTDFCDDNTITFKEDVYQKGSYKKVCDNIVSFKEDMSCRKRARRNPRTYSNPVCPKNIEANPSFLRNCEKNDLSHMKNEEIIEQMSLNQSAPMPTSISEIPTTLEPEISETYIPKSASFNFPTCGGESNNILSFSTLAGLSLCCILYTGSYCCFSFCISAVAFIVLGLFAAIGTWISYQISQDRCINPTEKLYNKLFVLEMSVAIQSVTIEMWYKCLRFDKIVTYVCLAPCLIPVFIYVEQENESILTILEKSVAISVLLFVMVSILDRNFYGIVAAIAYALSFKNIKKIDGSLTLSSQGISNWWCCFFTICAFQALQL
ncbi:uncharacterized protein LOC108740696 [Agrilus planipennis]|uniref:Uncharacterized protein LOC108740696 n=1 Tax=Agrilus planipennis TaxID=224129 RepID=A0A1W4XDW1_AGRPL|nr:uncharacterized protein LOC108740696 [Agrilus planipennis]